MTETEWLEGTTRSAPDWLWHAFKMLRFLREQGVQRKPSGRRKLRLLACACCRRLGAILSREEGHVLDVAEGLAEGCVDREEQKAVVAAAQRATTRYTEGAASVAVLATLRPNAANATHQALLYTFNSWARDPRTPGIVHWQRGEEIDRFQSDLFREIFGNPFRPVTLNPAWVTRNGAAAKHLAQTIYDERRFDNLPILADALEDAGCDRADILDHCRSQKEHVCGCWVVDLLLGRA
ncbi:MAG TPA: hypothetical protein VEL76_04390 [Gemmataceae bacterium]|nr:hypothetical protein [Gemmataceae bacterium]